MDVAILAAKAMIGLMLLMAGGAKLADVAGFATTMRLFVPLPIPTAFMRGCAIGVAVGEFALGAASLVVPSAWWVNAVIFVLACVFVVVSAAGYIFHRGQSCRCFGTLSQRKFDLLGILRSVAITAVAAVALARIRTAYIQLGAVERGLLAASAVLLGLLALTAAKSLSVSHHTSRG